MSTSNEKSDTSYLSDTSRDDILVNKRTAHPCIGVLGSSLLLASSYGFSQSIGTVQSYLKLHQLVDYSTMDIGWIIGLYTLLYLLLGLVTGPLIDYSGARFVAPLAVSLSTIMFFLLAECYEYWQFMLCLGILGGISVALAANLAVSMVGKLFEERRGIAMGFALAGASLGGVLFPLLLNGIFPKLGWAWSIRIIALVILVLTSSGSLCLILVSRSLPLNSDMGLRAATPSLEAFKSGAFSFISIGFAFLELAMAGINGLLPTFAVQAGFSTETSYNLVAVMNGCSCIGRISSGVAADYIGGFNALIFMLLLTSIFTGAIFVPFGAYSSQALYAFAALWGFGSGSSLSLIPVCIGKTCEAKDYGRYYGTATSVISISALISIPAGGGMLDQFGPVASAGFFLAIVLGGAFSFWLARWRLSGHLLGLRVMI